MILDKLYDKGLITPPKFLMSNVQLLVQMGSQCYGCAEDQSDNDLYGIVIPFKSDIFPHLRNEIVGFGTQIKRFEQYQQHGIEDKSSKKTYDITIFNIVKYFNLMLDCSPNIIDSIYVPRRCIIHSTPIGEHIRDNRKIFLHKKAWHTFRGYSFAQMSKIHNKTNSSNPKRQKTIEVTGYDTKFFYHVVRLLEEIEQILIEHDLDLERNKALLRSIRRGEWSLERAEKYFEEKEKLLQEVYSKSTLPHSADEEAIKRLLLESLEMHFGSISDAIKMEVDVEKIISDMQAVIDKYK